jgi:hypothetical protein
MGEAVSMVALKDTNKRTFFARFLRSLRSLRDALSTLVAKPDYNAVKPYVYEAGRTESMGLPLTRTKRYLGSNFLCTSSES